MTLVSERGNNATHFVDLMPCQGGCRNGALLAVADDGTVFNTLNPYRASKAPFASVSR